MHVLTNAEKLIPRRDAASLAESRKLAGIRIVTGTTSPFTRYERISVSPASCSIRSEYVIASYTFKLQYKCNNSTPAWEQRKLEDIANRVTRKNEGESDLPLTISSQYGLVDQRTFFNNQVASKDMSGYYLLRKGEFAYNKSTSGDSPWGAVKRLVRYEKGCVSTLYICFGLDGADPDFLVTYYETDRWYKAVQMIAAEGARNHGLLNIAPNDFFDTALILPPSREEQELIGLFFARLDNLITLHQRKYDKLVVFKKSMLEKMFPKDGESVPEIRFAGFTDPWEQRQLGELVTTTIGGGTPSTSNPAYWDGEIPWIQSSNVLEDTLFDVDIPKAITQKGLEESAAQIVPENSIAVVTHVGVGKLIYLPFQYSTSQDFISLCGLKGDARYTCYALWKRLQEDLHIVQGSAIKGITKEDLLEKNLPMPSVEEQAQIGVLFSQLDNLITLHQRKLELLQNIKKSLLDKMFV